MEEEYSKMPLINRKFYIVITIIGISVILMRLLWYYIPTDIRKSYYRQFCPDVYSAIVVDPNFVFSETKYSKTFDYDTKFIIPSCVEIYFDKINSNFPADPRKLFYVNPYIKVEVIDGEEVVLSVIQNDSLSVAYIPSNNTRYLSLLKVPTPIRAKWTDLKIRVTVLEPDTLLEGCTGTLVIKPDTYW